MTQSTKTLCQTIVAIIIPIIAGAVAYGVTIQRVSSNERGVESNRARISILEKSGRQYETDVRWIKETLLEIKLELREQSR